MEFIKGHSILTNQISHLQWNSVRFLPVTATDVLVVLKYPSLALAKYMKSYYYHPGELSVEVVVSPPGVTQQASSSINLTCVVSGDSSPPYSYQWTSTCTGNCFVLQDDSPTLTQLSLHSIDAGNHTCHVTDTLGNSGTATTEIVVTGNSYVPLN